MPKPSPQTIANEMYMDIAKFAMSGTMLSKTSSEYFSLRRRAGDLLKVDPVAGLGVDGALAALSGEVNRFEGIAEEVLKLPGHDIEKLYLVSFAKPLGLSALARRLFESVDLTSPVEIDRKITMAYALFYPEVVAFLRELAKRSDIPTDRLRINDPEVEMQNSIISMFASLGMGQQNFDAMNDVAARAALKAGFFLTHTPAYRYDVEDDYLSVSYSLPIDLNTAFDMEGYVDDISEGCEFFPGDKVAISFHPSGEV